MLNETQINRKKGLELQHLVLRKEMFDLLPKTEEEYLKVDPEHWLIKPFPYHIFQQLVLFWDFNCNEHIPLIIMLLKDLLYPDELQKLYTEAICSSLGNFVHHKNIVKDYMENHGRADLIDFALGIKEFDDPELQEYWLDRVEQQALGYAELELLSDQYKYQNVFNVNGDRVMLYVQEHYYQFDFHLVGNSYRQYYLDKVLSDDVCYPDSGFIMALESVCGELHSSDITRAEKLKLYFEYLKKTDNFSATSQEKIRFKNFFRKIIKSDGKSA